jgi:hypothetical protein
VHHIIESQ